MNRMWTLMEKGKHEGLSDAEKQELQRLFLIVAENDARVLEDMEEPGATIE